MYKGKWIISAPWQTGLSMGSPIGQVVGAFYASYPMEWFGRKLTFGACVILTTGFVFIQFFARSLPVLLVGELLGGLVLGTYATIAPTYASEVCPVALRGVLTSYINLCFVIGQLIANGVIAGTSKLDSHWVSGTIRVVVHGAWFRSDNFYLGLFWAIRSAVGVAGGDPDRLAFCAGVALVSTLHCPAPEVS